MALSLSCSCGAQFEVEETVAGQTVSCPECQQPVQAPAGRPQPVRTSGLALASTVLALVLAFTGFGTVLAVFLGFLALVVIARSRGRVTGVGYAVFGIIWGLVFTGLFAFAVYRGEVFGMGDGLRERLMGGQVDRSGPMEIRRPDKGFAITRPTAKWGVARQKLINDLDATSDIVIADVGKDAWIDIHTQPYPAWQSLDTLRNEMVRNFRNGGGGEDLNPFDPKPRVKPRLSNVEIRESKPIAPLNGAERAEIVLDGTVEANRITFVIHLIHSKQMGGRLYIVEGLAPKRRFARVEDELRKGLESFREISE